MSRLRAQFMRLPSAAGRPRAPHATRALVVGGGIAGIAAATVLCERGVSVTLLERETELGGRAGGSTTTLHSGEQVHIERGFHAFFRQYYNLRALLARLDPELRMLVPLHEYPILGPGGQQQIFRDSHLLAPLRVFQLAWQTPHLHLLDFLRINSRKALEMLRFDPERTYADFDRESADTYLSSLAFPPNARRMLFDVFAHSFFNPEADMSAAELLMMFHFYFAGNPHGLTFDVSRSPMTVSMWQPFEHWLAARGVSIEKGVTVQRIAPRAGGGYVAEYDGGRQECDLVVLALDVPGLQRLLWSSPNLGGDLSQVDSLRATQPFAVLRLWLDRPLARERAAFAGTTGVGELDSIACYEHFQDESAAWAAQHHGSVVELHAYALRDGAQPAAVRADLIGGLHALYPESQRASIVDERFSLHGDCPAFRPGSYAERPTPASGLPDLALAGDFVRMPFPCALMERAAASGILAANLLLARLGVAPEPLCSVPMQGVFAPIHTPRWTRALGSAHAG